MENILKLFIENPFSTLVVFISLSIFVWVVSKNIPNPIDKIGAILKVLLHEANPMTKKDWVERINWFSILIFAFALIIQLLLFGSSSIFESIFPNGNSNSLPSICLVTLILLFIITIFSPLLIILTKRDKYLRDKGQELLDR